MFLRALFAFLVLPGIVAFAAPIYWLVSTSRTTLVQPLGLLPLLVGCAVCSGACAISTCSARERWLPGRRRSTWSRPGCTATRAIRCTCAVLLIVLGWATAFGFRGLYWYALFTAIAFQVRVVLGEEPWLARTHGAAWDDYVRRVRRWF